MTMDYPDRLKGFAKLPMQDSDCYKSISLSTKSQIGCQVYAIDSVGRVELDAKREVIFRPVHLRSPN